MDNLRGGSFSLTYADRNRTDKNRINNYHGQQLTGLAPDSDPPDQSAPHWDPPSLPPPWHADDAHALPRQFPSHDELQRLCDEYNERAKELHGRIHQAPINKDDVVAWAGAVKSSAQHLMLEFLKLGLADVFDELGNKAIGLLKLARERTGRGPEQEFLLLGTAPTELLHLACDAVAKELNAFLDFATDADRGLIKILAGKVKLRAHHLMLRHLQTGFEADCRHVRLTVGDLLDRAWMRARCSSAPEFNLLDPAPEELRKRLAPEMCALAMEKLDGALRSPDADRDHVMALAEQVMKWAHCLMQAHLELDAPDKCLEVLNDAEYLLQHAGQRAGIRFGFMESCPELLLELLSRYGLQPTPMVPAPVQLQPSVGSKRSVDAALGMTVFSAGRPIRLKGQWSPEAVNFMGCLGPNLGLLITEIKKVCPCEPLNPSAKQLAEFAACGTAAIC